MEKGDLLERIHKLEEKIHKTINLTNQLKQEKRHLKEEIFLREEEINRARRISKENQAFQEKINKVKEHLGKLLLKFEKYGI